MQITLALVHLQRLEIASDNLAAVLGAFGVNGHLAVLLVEMANVKEVAFAILALDGAMVLTMKKKIAIKVLAPNGLCGASGPFVV